VTVYAPGSKTLLRTISQGVNAPDALAFGRTGNLFVANTGNNSVTAYAPESNTVLRTISQGVNYPYALAFGP
jgi:YVTN family beta-propeller protein